VNELVGELDSIEASFLEQGYTKDRNPSNSSSVGTVQVGYCGLGFMYAVIAFFKRSHLLVPTLMCR
jgi:hypothetical protein